MTNVEGPEIRIRIQAFLPIVHRKWPDQNTKPYTIEMAVFKLGQLLAGLHLPLLSREWKNGSK